MSNQRYNQLIKDLRSEYRPQREWGEGRGLLMVIGHFLVGEAIFIGLGESIRQMKAAMIRGRKFR